MTIDIASVSAITALVAVIVGPLITIYVAKKQIRSSVVSVNRQAWINRLRDEIANFVRDVKHMPSAHSAEAISTAEAISRHGEIVLREEVVKLLLNPEEEEHKELLRLMAIARKKAQNAINTNRGLATVLDEASDPIVAQTQKILKAEWERVKRGD